MTLPVLLFCSPIVKLLEPAHRTTCCCEHAPLALVAIWGYFQSRIGVEAISREISVRLDGHKL